MKEELAVPECLALRLMQTSLPPSCCIVSKVTGCLDFIITVRSMCCFSCRTRAFILSVLPFKCYLLLRDVVGPMLSPFGGLSVGPDTLSLSPICHSWWWCVPICQAYGVGGAQQIFVPVWSQRIFWNCLINSPFPLLSPRYTLSLLRQLWKSALESN